MTISLTSTKLGNQLLFRCTCD